MADLPGTAGQWERDIRQRLVRGEAAALGELYDRYARLVHRLAVRLVGDQKAAGEIVVQVFCHVWENPGEFDPATGQLPYWLADQTYARVRVRSGGCPPGPSELPEPSGSGAGTPSDASAVPSSVPGLVRAEAALEAMGRSERTALRLVAAGGMNYRQVAAELGISEEEALRRLRSGLELVADRTGTAGRDGR